MFNSFFVQLYSLLVALFNSETYLITIAKIDLPFCIILFGRFCVPFSSFGIVLVYTDPIPVTVSEIILSLCKILLS